MTTCGLDECGRGPLAGPIIAAAVILHNPIPGLRDSKQLTAEKRRLLFEKIAKCATVEIESISVRQINSRGIGWANCEVFRRLIKRIDAHKYVVDGNLRIRVRKKTDRIHSMIKADTHVDEVMAASIVAKVTRDALMSQLHLLYPQYGWQANMGYGTKTHVAALQQFGPCSHHRTLFVRTALKEKI